MSKLLQKFYNELQEWIDQGCPFHEAFERKSSICYNLEDWSSHDAIYLVLEEELNQQFRDAGLEKNYPFGGEKLFDDEYFDLEMMYNNPERLKWIKDHCNKPETVV